MKVKLKTSVNMCARIARHPTPSIWAISSDMCAHHARAEIYGATAKDVWVGKLKNTLDREVISIFLWLPSMKHQSKSQNNAKQNM